MQNTQKNRKILKIGATWCMPCKQLNPILESLKDEIIFEEYDVEKDNEIAEKYGIRNVPTMILLEDGEEISRKMGTQTKQAIVEWYNADYSKESK